MHLSVVTFLARSRSEDLDEAARAAAVRTTYSPQIFRCAPVSGIYQFRVDFTAG
jgi:hypothetical protein